MSIFDYIKDIGKKVLLVGLLGTVVGCSSINHLSKPEPHLKPTTQVVKDTKRNEKSLDGLDFSLSYQNESKSKIYNKININDVQLETAITETVDSVKTNTYEKFISDLSKLNEEQITLTLSSLASLAFVNLSGGGYNNINDKQVYELIKNFLNNNHPNQVIKCGHIHNFVSETARKAGLLEAITFSCETKETGHVISALWWPDESIKLIDYEKIYSGNSDLELLLREYQKDQEIPAFGHKVYRKGKHIFSFRTIDGKIFFNAIDYPGDTTQLKNILTKSKGKGEKHLEVRLGNTGTSINYTESNLFLKGGYLLGLNDFPWRTGFFQLGFEGFKKEKNSVFYDLNFNLLLSGMKDYKIVGICGNNIVGKEINISPSDNLVIVGQLACLIDIISADTNAAIIPNNDMFKIGAGINYSHNFDKKTKTNIYSFLLAEPYFNNVLTQNIKPNLSETRIGCKLIIENSFVNPEYIHRNQDTTLSLETGCNYGNLDLGFTLSTSNTRYKRIWPDEKSLELSTRYTSTNDLSIGGSIKHSQKKWPSDEKYDTKVKFWLEKRF